MGYTVYRKGSKFDMLACRCYIHNLADNRIFLHWRPFKRWQISNCIHSAAAAIKMSGNPHSSKLRPCQISYN